MISLLKLNSGLGFEVSPEVVFHLGHFRDQIGGLDQFRFGIAASTDDMQTVRFVGEELDYFPDLYVIVTQYDVDFVQ